MAIFLAETLKDFLGFKQPEVFESWDGYHIEVKATETQKPELKRSLSVTLYNEGNLVPHAFLDIDVDTEEVSVLGWRPTPKPEATAISNCPKCGGRLEFNEEAIMVTCPGCGATVLFGDPEASETLEKVFDAT